MKKRDLEIMSFLRNNARESLTDMSKKTSIPVSTIYDRLKTMIDDCIVKHTSLLDFSKIGFTTRAQILLKVHKDKRLELKDFLVKHHMINTVSKINNGYDFMIDGIFRHMKELEDFLEEVETRFDVLDKSVHYVIEDLKRETFLENPALLPILFEETTDAI